MEGRIVVITFPQDVQEKLRPALVLRQFPKYGDLLVCGISSKLYQFIPDFDLMLDNNHADYKMSGLKQPGICRLNMLTMLSGTDIKGSIGAVSHNTHNWLLQNLAQYLIKG